MRLILGAALVTAWAAQGLSVDEIWTFRFGPDGLCMVTDAANDLGEKCVTGGNPPWADIEYCLEKYPGHNCLASLTLTTRQPNVFEFTDTCNITKNNAQELDTTNFFIAAPEYQKVTSTDKFSITLGANAADCEVKLEFLPQLITNCDDPKKDNAPVATVDVKQDSPQILLSDVFKNRQSSSILITSANWTACGDGVTEVRYDALMQVKLEELKSDATDASTTDASSATTAVAGITAAAAIAALW